MPTPRRLAEFLICISADSRAEVDDFVSKAESAGGVIDPSPQDDYDFMYGRNFEDLDGHLWGVNWMDFEAVAKETAAPEVSPRSISGAPNVAEPQQMSQLGHNQ